MNTLEAALKYRKLQWSIIPIHAKTKKPLIRWKKYQTELPSEKDLRYWFGEKWLDANIALICGRVSGVFAIDFDSEEALECYRASYDMDIDMTMCQKTAKGMHALFNTGDIDIPLIQPVLEKIDLKGSKSYIMVEPSVHPSGVQYKWMNLNPLTDGTDDILDAPSCIRQLISDHQEKIKSKASTGGYGDTNHIEKPRNPEGWEQELLMGVAESERNTATTRLAGLYLNKNYGQAETAILLKNWNRSNTPPLPESEIDQAVQSIFGTHVKEKAQGMEGAIEKITIFRYPDGSNKYKLCLNGGKYVIIKMPDLLSSIRTIEKIADATRIVFDPPKRGRWFDMVRNWLRSADEEVVAVEESELGIIKEVIASWLVQWNRQKDSEHINLVAMINNHCVVDGGKLLFTLTHLEEDLRFKKITMTRPQLCESLKRLGARVTEPRKRFEGSRIRTWDILEKNCE